MFTLMLVSGIQICFLPGFLLYKTIVRKSSTNIFFTLMYSFAFSLIINYLLVTTLAYFNIYTKINLFIIIVVEIILLFKIFIVERQKFSLEFFLKKIEAVINSIEKLLKFEKKFTYIIKISVFGISLIISALLLLLLLKNLGKIFDSWDAVVSWNRWATDFFNNKLPVDTHHYPQLLPANWSISYVLMGYPFQYIARGIMPFFLLFMMLVSIIIGVKTRLTSFFIAAIMLLVFKFKYFWSDGYADVPVAFFALMSVYSIIIAKSEVESKKIFKYILLGAILAVGSAITKQAGIFLVVVFPIIVYSLLDKQITWKFKENMKYFIIYLALIIIIVLPFYIYTEINIYSGLEKSEIPHVTNEIYRGATLLQRFLKACNIFLKTFECWLVFIPLFFLWLLSFKIKLYRNIAVIITIPFYLIWSLFFSYDNRNAALLIPFFCLGVGGGVEYVLSKIDFFLKRHGDYFLRKAVFFKVLLITLLIIMCGLGIIFLNKKITFERLYNRHLRQEKTIGNERVNAGIYAYDAKHKINKKILTNYQIIKYLPELKQFSKIQVGMSLPASFDEFLTNLQDSNVGFILFPTYNIEEQIINFIQEKIETGEYELVFEIDAIRFVKIR